MPTWTPSSPTVSPQQVTTGQPVLAINAETMFFSSTYGTVFQAKGDRIAVRLQKVGTLTADCSMIVAFFIDDAATQFGVERTIPYATLNDANGYFALIPCYPGQKGRLILLPGTMTGANGLAASVRT